MSGTRRILRADFTLNNYFYLYCFGIIYCEIENNVVTVQLGQFDDLQSWCNFAPSPIHHNNVDKRTNGEAVVEVPEGGHRQEPLHAGFLLHPQRAVQSIREVSQAAPQPVGGAFSNRHRSAGGW